MGEVYRARDPRLGREVAIKLLAPEFSADADRLRRFEHEARAAAALNHPNIITVHSVEEDSGVRFLTMELVEGQSLSDLIPKNGMPLDRLLKIAIQLSSALSAASAKGIIHRDLKPLNIMIGAEGQLKILDFGLAKLREGTPAEVAVTHLATEEISGEGRIVGTVAYMSPEQAEGKSVDHRSDIFSLGVIFYEAATGERPFKGDSVMSVLSAILRETPRPLTEVRRMLPRDLERIVRRCLAKDPEDRYQTAKDLRNDLKELQHEFETGELAAGAVVAPSSPTRRGLQRYAVASVAAIAISATAFLSYRLLRPSERAADTTPVQATFAQLTAQPGLEQFPSVSPDGKWIIYTSDSRGREDIYLQGVGGRTPIDLTESSDVANWAPVFSPDGERIAFRSERAGGGIFVMGRTGESPARVSDSGFNPTWSPDGTEIAYATQNVDHPFTRGTVGELWAVNVTTGRKRRITQSDAVQPSWSPHGRRIAYWAVPSGGSQRDIWTVAAAGGAPVQVTNDPAVDWSPVWSPDGRYLYFSSDRGGSMNLWRVPIDEDTGHVLGPPQPVTTPAPFLGHLSFSADGHRLVYASLLVQSNIAVIDFDPVAGKVLGQPRAVTQGTRYWWAPEPSPDGQWVAFNAFGPEDVYVSRSNGSDLRQLTHDFGSARNPHWSPDGAQITFYSSRSGVYNIWKVSPDGSALQQLTFADYALFDGTWSADGRMYAADSRTGRARSLIIDPNRPWKDQTPRVLPTPPGVALRAGAWSPDSKKLAGTGTGMLWILSVDSGKFDRLPLPVTQSRNSPTILAPGVAPPTWLSDGRRVISAVDGRLFLTDTTTRQTHELLALSGVAVNYPSLSKDNRHLYFARGSVEGDIWMATLK